MDKTEFKPVADNPKSLEELVAWLRKEHKSHEPKPADVEWRLLLLIKWLDVRLCEHEQALMKAYEAAHVHAPAHKFVSCSDCGAIEGEYHAPNCPKRGQ